MSDGPIKYSDLFDPLGPGAAELADFGKAVASLSRQYRTFAKNIDEDKARVQAGLDAIKVQAGLISTQASQLSALNEQERAGFAALQAQVTSLITEQKRLNEVQAAQAKAQTTVKDATQQAAAALKAMQNELRAAYAAQDTARVEKAAAAIRSYKTETQTLSLAIRGTNSELTAARGSYDALVVENTKLISSLRGLAGGLESGSQEALQLQKQIATNTQTLKDFDANILIFNRNVGNYAGGFSGLVQELAKARAAQASLSAGSEEYNRQQIKVQGFQTAAQKSAAQMGLSYEQAEAKINGATTAIQPLTTSLLRLEKEQDALAASTGRETEAYRKIGFQIEATKKEINDVAVATTQATSTNDQFSQQLGFTREGLLQYGTQLAAGVIGIQALAEGVKAFFSLNKEYSAELAAVRKTTGLTADEADRLGQSLQALDTPTTLKGLLNIAEVGGQLGIAKDDLLAFTKAVDIGVQALGNDFTGGAEEIATTLGKISSVFRKELGTDAAQNILAIGSAVNQIGADGAATAPFLTDVALRVGAVSAQAGVGLKNVLAYAAVLQETGFSAETSGTALNKFFSVLSTKTKESFDIARKADPSLTLKEFTHVVNTDFNGAIQLFLKGLNAGGQTTTDLSQELKTLKLQSGEAKSAIITLAQNTDLFAERQKTANDQLRDATSLAAEAAINNDTLAGSVDKLTNETKNFFTSGAASNVLKFLVDFTRTVYGNTIGNVLRSLGDGLGYVGEKLGLVTRPQEDFTAAQVNSILAATKQVASQQQLLESYVKLSAATTRSGAQEQELALARQQLLAQFSTDDAKQIQARIDNRKRETDANRDELARNLAQYTTYVDEARSRAAAAEQALTKVAAGVSAEQLARIKANAAAGKTTPLRDETETQAQFLAAKQLAKATDEVSEAERRRALYAAALAKVQPAVTKASLDAADAAGTEAQAEAELDRASKARSDAHRADLQGELADNQRRIDTLRKDQTEQAKLFADKQLNEDQFRASVAGSEDAISQLERTGTALRIRVAREETAGKLIEIENERIRLSAKKHVTQDELTEIENAAGINRITATKERERKIAGILRAGQEKLEVKPLEFKVTDKVKFIDPLTLKESTKAVDDFFTNLEKSYQRDLVASKGRAEAQETELTLQYARGEIGEEAYQDRLLAIKKEAASRELAIDAQYYKEAGDAQHRAAEVELAEAQRAADKKKRIVQQAFATTQAFADSYFQIGNDQRAAELADLQSQKDKELIAAGENAELKAKINDDYAKRELAAKRKQAQYDKAQALFNVAINTALAVTSVLSTGGGTRYADFGISAGILSALVIASGVAQAVAIAAKPLPNYFKGRPGGPAEFANLAEQGPELVGRPGAYRLITQPSVGYLAQGDAVVPAQETRRILAQNELVEGRLFQRAQAADMETQTARLRMASVEQAAQQAAAQLTNSQIIGELRELRKTVREQEQLRVSEEGLERWKRSGETWQHHVNKRYHHGR